MSKLVINDTTLNAIGDAIRAKTGKSDLIAPGAMPDEIEGIQTGGGYEQGVAEQNWLGFENSVLGGYDEQIEDNFLPTNVFLHDLTNNTWLYNAEEKVSHYGCDIVVIPSNITYIKDFAFEAMPSWEHPIAVICLAPEPPAMGWQGGWSSIGGCYPPYYIYVPDSSIDKYKSATDWAEYAAIIVGISELTKEIIVGGFAAQWW